MVAEVIESKHKPRRAGDAAESTFVPPADVTAAETACRRGGPRLALCSLGHQDTDPLDLTAPTGLRITGAPAAITS